MLVLSRLLFRSDCFLIRAASAANATLFGRLRNLQNASNIRIAQEIDSSGSVKTFCTQSIGYQSSPSWCPPQRNHPDLNYQRPSYMMRRKVKHPEARMLIREKRIKESKEFSYRDELNEASDLYNGFQLDWSKLYQKGDPGTVQAIVKKIIFRGFIVKLPNGRDGFVPSHQLGCWGGTRLNNLLFKVGQEVTVRVEPFERESKMDKAYMVKDKSQDWFGFQREG